MIGKNIIAESEKYYLEAVFEKVFLFSKSNNEKIACIGDFYGDAECAIIDRNEKFCAAAGCGYIIYYLKEPFEDYRYDKQTMQWLEDGRIPANIKWIRSIRQINDNQIELTDENNNKEIITVFGSSV